MKEAMSPLQLENFIDGEYVEARTGRRTELIDPSTGEVYGDAPASSKADVDLAYESAAKAFEGGRSTTPPSARQLCFVSLTRSKRAPMSCGFRLGRRRCWRPT
jgi:Aldehyde dehydrogenase family